MIDGATPADDLDTLLAALDEADVSLRALYRLLAEDPDGAAAHDARLKELHTRRLDLAQRVGLAALGGWRADRRAEAAVPEVPQPEAKLSGATPEPVHEPESAAASDADVGPLSERATNADVDRWKDAVRSAGFGSEGLAAPSPQTAWPLVLHDLMEELGAPRSLDSAVGVVEEIDALDDIGTDARQALWARLPKHAQQAWLTMLVARTRALKQLPSATPATKERVKTIIGRYPAWAKLHMPGHVNGMRLTHEPVAGSWTEDARASWAALADLLGDAPVGRPAPASTRKPKREKHDEGDAADDVDESWPLLSLVRGRRAVMLGGDPREPNRERLERVLQLTSLEWPPIDGPRKVAAVVERIRRHAYDLVLVLQPFVAHKQSDAIIEAARSATTSWALVEGYGASAVKRALERFLGGHGSGASLPDEADDAEGR